MVGAATLRRWGCPVERDAGIVRFVNR